MTRLRSRGDAPRYTPATWKGAFDDTSQGVTARLALHPGGPAAQSASATETSSSATWDVANVRFVSDPLAAQTITGTFDLLMRVSESASTNDDCYHIHVWVTTGDTDTVRGTLLADYVETTSNEWPTSAAGVRIASPQTLASVAVTAGDRIVVEVGYIARNTSALSKSAIVTYGSAVGVDLAAGDTSSGLPGWVEFSQDLLWQATTLYLNNHAAPSPAAAPSGFLGAWDDTAGAVTKQIAPDKYDGGAQTTVARAETSTDTSFDVCLYRGISGPLAAQTIAGNLDAAIGLFESNASADDVLHLHVWVMKTDGTARGTLLTDYVETLGAGTEFATAASSSGRALAAVQALSSLAVSSGDRIVIEVGYRAKNSSATSFTGTLVYGGTTATDGTEGDAGQGGNMSSNNVASWVQFVSGVGFNPPDARVSQVVCEVIVLPDTQAARVSQLVAEVVVPSPVSTGSRNQVTVAN